MGQKCGAEECGMLRPPLQLGSEEARLQSSPTAPNARRRALPTHCPDPAPRRGWHPEVRAPSRPAAPAQRTGACRPKTSGEVWRCGVWRLPSFIAWSTPSAAPAQRIRRRHEFGGVGARQLTCQSAPSAPTPIHTSPAKHDHVDAPTLLYDSSNAMASVHACAACVARPSSLSSAAARLAQNTAALRWSGGAAAIASEYFAAASAYLPWL
eukprot:350555-Chlamydomonas_euryale.AAC.2